MPTEVTQDDKTRVLAERVMGWTYTTSESWWQYPNGSGVSAKAWSPFTRWDHAGDVVEAMCKKGWLWDVSQGAHFAGCPTLYFASFSRNRGEAARLFGGETFPAAIAEAAYRAIIGEKE